MLSTVFFWKSFKYEKVVECRSKMGDVHVMLYWFWGFLASTLGVSFEKHISSWPLGALTTVSNNCLIVAESTSHF